MSRADSREKGAGKGWEQTEPQVNAEDDIACAIMSLQTSSVRLRIIRIAMNSYQK